MDRDARPDVPLGRRMPNAKTRVVVADRNVITRVGVRAILERVVGVAVIAEATSYDATLDAVDEHGPDVLIIDLDLGDDTTRGLKLVEDIVERFPTTKVLVLANSLVSIGLYLAMVQRGDATRISSYMYLVPPLAMVLAWALLGERLHPLALAGLALSAFGVYVVSYQTRYN